MPNCERTDHVPRISPSRASVVSGTEPLPLPHRCFAGDINVVGPGSSPQHDNSRVRYPELHTDQPLAMPLGFRSGSEIRSPESVKIRATSLKELPKAKVRNPFEFLTFCRWTAQTAPCGRRGT